MANGTVALNGGRGPLPTALALTMIVGAGVAMATLTRRRPVRGSPDDAGREALSAYLHDHLSGAAVAIQVVERLRRTSPNADDRRLFEWLYRQFDHDREVVESVLQRFRVSHASAKRFAGHASGTVLKFFAGGARGDLALFRTLEALSVGVQGKRCMWRTLRCVGPGFAVPGHTLPDLESGALRQWEAIEERRQALVPQTFAGEGLQPSGQGSPRLS